MRGLVDGLATPHPLAVTLPGVLQEDDFVVRLCAALDDVLAPVLVSLDNLPAHFDPGTTPDDMVDWLAGWVGLTFGLESLQRRRDLIGAAVELHRWRGTVRGVRHAVTTLLGVEPEVEDSGGALGSQRAGSPLPGDAGARLTVRVRVPDVAAVDVSEVEAVVAAVKPAHVVAVVEVLAEQAPAG